MFPLTHAALDEEPERLLTELYAWFEQNHAAFQDAEGWSSRSSDRYQKAVGNFRDALENDGAWEIPHPDKALALLSALDEYALLEAPGGAHYAPATYTAHGRGYQLLRRPVPFDPPARGQRGHLSHWLRHHRVLPLACDGGFAVEVAVADADLRRRCLAAGGLTAYVGDFDDGASPGSLAIGDAPLVFEGIDQLERRWQSIEAHLHAAAATGAQLVVLPELTVTPALRYRAARWLEERSDLPFLLVLPGSFHERLGERFCNRAELFTADGRPVLEHRKLTVACAGGRCEDIERGREVRLLAVNHLAGPLGGEFLQLLFAQTFDACRDLAVGVGGPTLRPGPDQ